MARVPTICFAVFHSAVIVFEVLYKPHGEPCQGCWRSNQKTIPRSSILTHDHVYFLLDFYVQSICVCMFFVYRKIARVPRGKGILQYSVSMWLPFPYLHVGSGFHCLRSFSFLFQMNLPTVGDPASQIKTDSPPAAQILCWSLPSLQKHKNYKLHTNVGGWVLWSGREQLRETGSTSAAPPATSHQYSHQPQTAPT